MAFSTDLLRGAEPLWRAMVGHPFVQEMAAGRLPRAKFDIWVQQDYLYVAEFGKLLGMAVAKAGDASIRDGLIGALAGLGPEVELFRQYARDNNLPLDVAMAPTCQSYASYILSVAALGDINDIITALFAAERAYYDTWSGVKGKVASQNPYAGWIANWTSEPFGRYVAWLGAALDGLADGLRQSDLARLRQVFLTTVRYEYMFWDMCYRQEQWPV